MANTPRASNYEQRLIKKSNANWEAGKVQYHEAKMQHPWRGSSVTIKKRFKEWGE